jgi:hypothetical protein
MTSFSSSSREDKSAPAEAFGITLIQSYSKCLNTLAKTEISSEVRTKETPTLPNVEEILESEKLVKDVEELSVHDASRFFAALRCIALFIISSSVALAPS